MAKRQSKVRPKNENRKQSPTSTSPLHGSGESRSEPRLAVGTLPLRSSPHAGGDRVGGQKLESKNQLIPYLNGRQLPPSGYMLVDVSGELFWADPASMSVPDIETLRTLTKSQKDRVSAYVKILAEHIPSSLKKVLHDLEREPIPERELRCWERMAQVYRLELSKRPNAQKVERMLLWAVILHFLNSGNLEHVLSAVPLARKLPDVKRVARTMMEHGVAYVMQTKLRLDLKLIKHYAETVEPIINDNISTISSELRRQIIEMNDVERMDFEALSSDPAVTINDVFLRTLRTSAFISAYALFESTLMQLCKMLGNMPDYPSFVSNRKGDGLRESKEYLRNAGFQFPADINEWRKLQFYKSIRNIILHADSTLDSSDDARRLREFIEKEKIGSVAQDGHFSLNRKAVNDISAVIDSFSVALRRTLERT